MRAFSYYRRVGGCLSEWKFCLLKFGNTQGPHAVIAERGDADESLIDPIHGHGSQSLINLLLTGSATQNVFDGVKDLCGLKLQGIEKQASVGFLSYLECLRYLEVNQEKKSLG